jgi:hypothetical protein
MNNNITKTTVTEQWQVLHLFPPGLKADAYNLHQATQLVAMAGKYFIPETTDDSHTASRWIPGKNLQVRGLIPGAKQPFHVGLKYDDFSLQLLTPDMETIAFLPLNGQTFVAAFQWLWNQLKAQGLAAEKLLPKMHFDIPDHPIKHGEPFRTKNPKNMLELARHRTNGHLLHLYFRERLQRDDALFIWPHHFDEGLYLPLEYQGKEPVSSVSFGLAMPDIYYPEPYFYVTEWQKKGFPDMSAITPLSHGHWHKKDWNGQVLKTQMLVKAGITASEQAGTALEFLQTAINNALKMVHYKPLL